MIDAIERSMRGLLEFVSKVKAGVGAKDEMIEKEGCLVYCSNMPNNIELLMVGANWNWLTKMSIRKMKQDIPLLPTTG